MLKEWLCERQANALLGFADGNWEDVLGLSKTFARLKKYWVEAE